LKGEWQMPTGNSVKTLFNKNDFNTRTSIFHVDEKLQPFEKKIAWIEKIKCALGKKIINNTDLEFIDIVSNSGYHANRFVTGKQLIELIYNSFKEPVSLRISFPGWPTRSWIILLHQDVE